MNPSSSISRIFRQMLHLIGARRKKQFWLLLGAMFVLAGLETLTLGAIAFFATAVSSPAQVMNSSYIRRVNEVLPLPLLGGIEGIITSLSVLVFLLVGMKNALAAFIRYWSTRFAATVQGYFGEVLLDHFLNVRYEWHLKENPSDLINAVTWRQYCGQFIDVLLQLLSDALVVAIMLCALIVLEPIVTTMVIVVLGGTSLLLISRIKRLLDRETVQVREYSRMSFISSAKSINGIKDVKIFQKESAFQETFRDIVYRMARLIGKQRLYSRAPVLILETAGFFMLSATVVGMLYLMRAGTTHVFATLALLAVTAWRVLPSLNRIMGDITHLRTTIPFIEKVFEFIDRTPLEKRWENPETGREGVFRDKLSLMGVSYSYNGKDVQAVRECSCVIEKGQSIGIIGHSGAGKSTLVDLIIGLLEPQSGRILLDGREMTREDWSRWRAIVGYVPQFPYIYNGTVAENIAFGTAAEAIDRAQVLEVCRMASMEFLDELPSGIDTVIGERGVRLSGGQRQRLAIARALYKRPEVLIFDEATSSLDGRSEKEIKRTMYSFKGKLTLIVIAHRLSTIEDCDYLVWLEKGETMEVDRVAAVLDKYASYSS